MQRCYRVAKSTKQIGENGGFSRMCFIHCLNYDRSLSFSFEERFKSRGYLKQIASELHLLEPHQEFFFFRTDVCIFLSFRFILSFGLY